MNVKSQQIIVGALAGLHGDIAPDCALGLVGRVVFRERTHPVAELVIEVREMADGAHKIWHHYGDPRDAWVDDLAGAFPSLDAAVGQVREYQAAIGKPSSNCRKDVCVR